MWSKRPAARSSLAPHSAEETPPYISEDHIHRPKFLSQDFPFVRHRRGPGSTASVVEDWPVRVRASQSARWPCPGPATGSHGVCHSGPPSRCARQPAASAGRSGSGVQASSRCGCGASSPVVASSCAPCRPDAWGAASWASAWSPRGPPAGTAVSHEDIARSRLSRPGTKGSSARRTAGCVAPSRAWDACPLTGRDAIPRRLAASHPTLAMPVGPAERGRRASPHASPRAGQAGAVLRPVTRRGRGGARPRRVRPGRRAAAPHSAPRRPGAPWRRRAPAAGAPGPATGAAPHGPRAAARARPPAAARA